MNPAETSPPPVFCGNCGEAFVGDARFCMGCGVVKAGGAPSADASVAQPWTPAVPGCGWCRDRPRDAADPLDPFCPVCRRLEPLGPDYVLPVEAFMWSLDAQAMSTLRSITPLTMAAHALSERVGRPWLEASVNGIRLGPDQLPDVFLSAIKAARILGLPSLPELYISGEQMWDCLTLGSETQAFIVVGSIISNFKADDMLYILGREMGHIAAGHALWKTLMQFSSGRQQNKTIMGHGVMQFINPAKILESAIDAPLMAWARHAEITADRAGALVVGQRDVARRVSIQWSLKSFPLYPRLNLEALDREIAQSDERQLQVSEWTMSSTPYLARRLRLMNDFFASEGLTGWRAVIDHWLDVERRAGQPPPRDVRPPPQSPEPTIADGIKLTCIGCDEVMRVPRAELEGKATARVKCPNPACAKILEVTPKPPDKVEVNRIVPPSVRLNCVACAETMQVPVDAIMANAETHVRCPNAACRTVLTIRRPVPPAPEPPETPPPSDLVEED